MHDADELIRRMRAEIGQQVQGDRYDAPWVDFDRGDDYIYVDGEIGLRQLAEAILKQDDENNDWGVVHFPNWTATGALCGAEKPLVTSLGGANCPACKSEKARLSGPEIRRTAEGVGYIVTDQSKSHGGKR